LPAASRIRLPPRHWRHRRRRQQGRRGQPGQLDKPDRPDKKERLGRLGRTEKRPKQGKTERPEQPVRPEQRAQPVLLECLVQTDEIAGRVLITLSGLGDQKRGRECNLPFFNLSDRSKRSIRFVALNLLAQRTKKVRLTERALSRIAHGRSGNQERQHRRGV